jgi:hypothetical protein
MAGNYADAPNNRLSWNLDGTQLFEGGSQLSQGAMDVLNGETLGQPWDRVGGVTLTWFFPRLMDITGIAWGSQYNGQDGGSQWSANATNATDGTWTGFTAALSTTGNASTVNMRQQVRAVSLSGVRALKATVVDPSGAGDWLYYHIFGRVTAGQDANRVEFWHPTLDQRVDPAWFDWGNAARSSTADKTFRIKNLSSTLTANNILLSFNATTDTTPSVPAMHYVSSDGTNFFANRTITSLAPGAISAVYTARRVMPSNAVLSLWWARIKASVSSWT